MKLAAVMILSLPLAGAGAPAVNPELLTGRWTASWIAPPAAAPHDYGVYHFRRVFVLPAKPEKFVVHVSADQRYQLFVNGRRVAWGPARGDLYHWRFETLDLAPHLNAGRNVAAAVVWNFGEHAPVAQITNRTAFLMQGDSAAERVVDTGAQPWKCLTDPAYSPIPFTTAGMRGYYVVGPGDRVDGAVYPWGWEQPSFDDSSWTAARVLTPASPRDSRDAPSRWMLVPRSIPMMEEKPEAQPAVRKAQGITASGFPLRVPAGAKVEVLLDQRYLTTGYPELTVTGGKDSRIRLAYAETLFEPGRKGKGNRDAIEGKEFFGNYDDFLPDGGSRRVFEPLWWRTWRYLQLSVETRSEPVTIEYLRGRCTGYPFERKARFETDSEEIGRILDVGWRTARLCAHETYMDCPYYEQLQYAGDTRIQALVSLYMSGDGRLMRNAIEQLDSSRTAEGATYSRAPSQLQQYIPPFSLWWIGMVHDYWMYQDDAPFVRRMLPGVRAVLSFFAGRQKANGSLGRLPWWNYVDWVGEWKNGVPPSDGDGSAASIDLQLLLAQQWAAAMEESLGSKALAGEYRASAKALAAAIRSLYYDSSRRLYADTPSKKSFSQHANSLAVLAGLEAPPDLMDRVLTDASLTQCSIYFRYYLHAAARKAGLGDRYLDLLGQWRDMLARGLTTWAEKADPTRSDCHAWGASPNIEVFRTLLGVDSAAPGFRRVLVQPHLGKLERAAGTIPHPAGEITVRFERKGNGLTGEIRLPEKIYGDFVHGKQRLALKPGFNKVTTGR